MAKKAAADTTTAVVEAAPAEKPQMFKPPSVTLAPITTEAQYVATAEVLKKVNEYIDRVEAFYKPRKKRTYDLWQAEIADEKTYLAPAQPLKKQAAQLLADYDTERERIAAELKRKAEEQARKDEERRRIEQAAALEAEAERTGDEDLLRQAEQLTEEPIEEVTVIVEKQTPKVAGLSFRETWSAEVTDLLALVKWVAQHPDDLNLLEPNMTALNQMARARQANLKIDGVKAVKTKGASQRR